MPLWDIGWLQEPAAVVLLLRVIQKCSLGLLREKKLIDMEQWERRLQKQVKECGKRRPNDMKMEGWWEKGSNKESRFKEEKRSVQKRRKDMKALYEV